MEHSDLVAEMVQVEHLTTQERLHLARRRRVQQLKLWTQREREWLNSRPSKQKREKGAPPVLPSKTKRNIFFSDSVMLLEAAARNDIEEVRRLLSKGVTPDATNEDGLTALHQCCIDNNQDMLQLLLDKGANVNAEDSEKWTPLHAAATCGHLQLVRILIQRGANLLAVNADGNMPYDICEDEATLDCIEGEMAARGVTQRLIDATRAATERRMLRDLKQMSTSGGDLEVRDQHGATPLHIAAANGYIKVVEFLLDNHVSTDVKDHDFWQPVHAAACWGHMEVLEVLVHNGADLNAKNKHDETPADICEDSEMRARIAQLLIERESRLRVSAGSSASGGGGGGGRRGTPSHRPASSSSRAHSVRRTSLRERGLTAKHDAHEEARMRQTFGTSTGLPNGPENNQNIANQVPNGPSSPQKRPSNGSASSELCDPGGSQQTNDSSPPKQIAISQNGDSQSQKSTDIDNQSSSSFPSQVPKITNPVYGMNNNNSQYLPNSTNNSTPQNPLYNGYSNGNKKSQETKGQYDQRLHSENGTPQKIFNGVRKAPEGQDNESFINEEDPELTKDNMIVSSNQLDLPTDASSAAHYITDNNGKINVHVTVMINAGTLADLKKQRAQNRNASPTESTLLANETSGGQPSPPTVSPGSPASPPQPVAGDVPRFSGNTGEVVGDARSRRCCVIM